MGEISTAVSLEQTTAWIWELASANPSKATGGGGGGGGVDEVRPANIMTFPPSNNKQVLIFCEEHLVQIGRSFTSTSNYILCCFLLPGEAKSCLVVRCDVPCLDEGMCGCPQQEYARECLGSVCVIAIFKCFYLCVLESNS